MLKMTYFVLILMASPFLLAFLLIIVVVRVNGLAFALIALHISLYVGVCMQRRLLRLLMLIISLIGVSVASSCL